MHRPPIVYCLTGKIITPCWTKIKEESGKKYGVASCLVIISGQFKIAIPFSFKREEYDCVDQIVRLYGNGHENMTFSA
jgi:hypothetical protein